MRVSLGTRELRMMLIINCVLRAGGANLGVTTCRLHSRHALDDVLVLVELRDVVLGL